MTGKQIEKWADDFMFASEKHNAAEGPKAYLLNASNDPLGQIAACAKMYMGQVVRDLADVTDEERRHYLAEMQKTKLKMPLEAVSMHFMFENVTRAFTHQLVRQRTAAYAQESMRFAVVEDMTEAVSLPPSLMGTVSRAEWAEENGFLATAEDLARDGWSREQHDFMIDSQIELHASEVQKQRFKWDETVSFIGDNYMNLVNQGMPAEEARGLMPTNIITRINYLTNFRGLLDHAGNRLCTQAQFEWRIVFAQIAQAMRDFGQTVTYKVEMFMDDQPGDETVSERYDEYNHMWRTVRRSSAWQWEAIAELLRPVCYQTGSCAFKADFDRKCSIRNRVDANAQISRPSSEWDTALDQMPPTDAVVAGYGPRSVVMDEDVNQPVFIGAIHPREWLADHAAAR